MPLIYKNAKVEADFVIYGKKNDPKVARILNYLEEEGLKCQIKDISEDGNLIQEMIEKVPTTQTLGHIPNMPSEPQIFDMRNDDEIYVESDIASYLFEYDLHSNHDKRSD